jgi:hypothetical protein
MTMAGTVTPSRPWLAIVRRLDASHVVLGFVAIVMLGLLLRLLTRHTFWYDEAMLLTNITEGTLGELFGPLPFYDQAAPLLYVLLLKLIHTLAGLNEVLLRLPSWFAGGAALWIMARRMPGLTNLERACAAAVLAGSYTFAYLTTEAKQYNFEVLCACVLMAFFQGPAASVRGLAARLAFLLGAMMAASTFPVLVFAVGAVDQLRGVRRLADMKGIVWPRVAAGGWVLAVAAVCYVPYYLVHVRPAYQAVLGNFGYTYESFGFARTSIFPVWLVGNVWDIIESHFAIFGVLIIAAVAVGILRLRGRGTAYPAQAATLAATIIALNAAGLFPLLPARFSVFLMPWLAVLAGVAVAWVLSLVADRGIRVLLAAAAMCIVMVPALHCIADPTEHESRRSVAFLKAAQSAPDKLPVAVTVSAQPVYDLYLKTPVVPGADRCIAPGIIGYTNRCRAIKTPGEATTFAGPSTKWYLLNYVSVIGRGLEPVGFTGPAPQAYADSYIEWLVGALPVGQPVLLYTAPPTEKDTDAAPLQARLTAIGSVERLVDERLIPSTSRAGQIDRVVRRK